MREELIKFGNKIRAYTKEPLIKEYFRNVLKDNTRWASTHLFAELLYKSSRNEPRLTKEIVVKFAKKHKKDKGVKINVESLVEKNWLRFILEEARIPKHISSAIYRLKEKQLSDIQLLSHLIDNDLLKSKTKDEVELIVDGYNRKFSKKEKTEEIIKTYLFQVSLKEENYQLKPYYHAEVLIEKNKNELEFLSVLQEKERSLKYLISQPESNKVIKKHTKLFSTTPNFNDLVKEKNLVKHGANYELRLSFGIQGDEKIYRNEIIAILLDKIFQDDNYTNDKEKVIDWLDRVGELFFWQSDFLELVNKEIRDRFLNAIKELILSEEDIKDVNQELSKLLIDYCHDHNESPLIREEVRFKFEKEWNYYETVEQLEQFDRNKYDIIRMQRTRDKLSSLISCVVVNDKLYNEKVEAYHRVFELLDESIKSPFLLYRLFKSIELYNPLIIPHLLVNEKYASLGIYMLQGLELNDSFFDSVNNNRGRVEQKLSLFIDELVMDGMRIFLKSSISSEKKAEQLYELLLPVFIEKYQEPNRNTEHLTAIQNKKNKLENIEKLLKLIKSFKKDTKVSSGGSTYHYPLLMEDLIIPLFENLKKDKEPLPETEMVSIPLWKIDFAFWLLKITNELQNKPNTDYALLNTEIFSWIENYLLEFIKKDKGLVQGRFSEKPDERLLRWKSYQYGIEFISWEKLFIYLNEKHELDEFLNCNKIKFKTTDAKESDYSYYDKYNEQQVYKIRLQLLLSLIVHNRLFLQKRVLMNRGVDVDSILFSLQKFIEKCVSRYAKEDIKNGVADIFQDHYEHTIFYPKAQELLPLFIFELNKFEKLKRRKIIKSFFKDSNDLSRMLVVFERLMSEGDKKYLKDIIKNKDVESFLKEQVWLTKIEQLLISAVNNEDFTTEAASILDYFEKAMSKRKLDEENELFLYHLKLLLAYRKKEEKEIDKIVMPEPKYGNSKVVQRANEKKVFFKALFDINNKNYLSAIKKFENQLQSGKQLHQVAINKFYAELLMAKSEEDKEDANKLFQKALDNWIKYKSNYEDESFEEHQSYLLVNELIGYNSINDNDSFDSTWNKLSINQQYIGEYLKEKVDNLMKRNLKKESILLINEAREYHKLYSGEAPQFLTELSEKVGASDITEELKKDYTSIISLSNKDLVKVIPDVINPYNNVSEFILYELVYALMQLLKKVTVFTKNSKEDEYTDLIEVMMRGQLRAWNRSISSQARIGYADSDKGNVGEADLSQPIDLDMITYEAVRYYSNQSPSYNWKNIDEHIQKSFDYDPSRNLFYLIVYYEKNIGFKDAWKKYKTKVLAIKFNKEVTLISKEVEDLTKFSNDSTILVGKTLHNSSATMFHIFVNMDYKTKKDKAKPTTKKTS